MQIKPIAYIRSDFVEKFGIPRQSNLADTRAEIHFLPEYQNADALREIEAYDYLWLIWEFSESIRDTWSPTVRPPRLGGNRRVGVFATRSPFRPNPIGLSSVKLIGVEFREKEGPVLIVEGADLLDMTPIYDIKPYLPYVDSHPEAKGGFAEEKKDYKLDVNFPEMYLEQIPAEKRAALIQILEQDPRPSYQKDPVRIYGMSYAGMEIHFRVDKETLYVTEVERSRKSIWRQWRALQVRYTAGRITPFLNQWINILHHF